MKLSSSFLYLTFSLSFQGTTATSKRSQCLLERSNEVFEAGTGCGNKQILVDYIANAPDYFSSAEIEWFFTDAGCSAQEAAIEAQWIIQICDGFQTDMELRRRQAQQHRRNGVPHIEARATGSATATTEASTTESSTAASTATSDAIASTASSTATSTDSSSSSGTSSSSTTSSTSSTSTVTGASVTVTSGSTTTVLPCSTTSTITTSACLTSGATTACSAVTTTSAACASGMLCQTSTAGADMCKVRDDSLDTSGLIVTIMFVALIVAFVAGICFGCCSDRRKQRMLRDKAEAAALLKENAIERGSAPTIGAAAAARRSRRASTMLRGPSLAVDTEMNEFPRGEQVDYDAAGYEQRTRTPTVPEGSEKQSPHAGGYLKP